jgi:hypothetical protein
VTASVGECYACGVWSYLLPDRNATCKAAGHCRLRSRCKVCALAAQWKTRYSRKTNQATRAKGPYLLTNWNATYTEGAHSPLRSIYHVSALAANWKARYSRKRTKLQRAHNNWPIGTPLTQKVRTTLCAPVIILELWPRIWRRHTAEKQTKLQEQRALTYFPIGTPLTRKVPQTSAPQFSCLSPGRAVEAGIQP